MARFRAVLRIVLPALLIIAWLAGASFGGPLFGKIDEVSSNDQTAYLPSSAEATEVQQRLDEFRDSDEIPAIAVFTSEDPIGDDA
ncbi:MAG TPA: MMPL family transporter, partial [Microbacterium sp.]|nr:MMPL family transporter [Microbacterium sp.]